VKKTNKNKRLYIGIGILILVVIIIAIIGYRFAGNIDFSATGNIWDGFQTEQKDQPIDCNVASLEILDFTIEENSARLLLRNNGNSNNLKLESIILYNEDGSRIGTTTDLDQNFDIGKIKSFSFKGTGIECNEFSRVTVTTNCQNVAATFDTFPKGC